MTAIRTVQVGAVVFLSLIVVAFVAKPNSLKSKLEKSGIVLIRTTKPQVTSPFIWNKPGAGFFEMPQAGEAKFVGALKRQGFQSQFGKSKVTTTPTIGKKDTAHVEVFTRGIFFKPFYDYDRVWIFEHEGRTTVCFDPDIK